MRVAELMRLSERSTGRRTSSPGRVPFVPAGTAGAFATSCPTWSDAVNQISVSNSVHAQLQALVQPRLDTFAERLGGIVAAAQTELRDLERLVLKSEANMQSRLTGLEGRVAVLADGAARTEQRERDLNVQIAGIAESLLKRAENVAMEEGHGQRLDILKRSLEEKAERLDQNLEVVEESCKKSAKIVQKLDSRLHDLEEHSRSWPRLAEERRALTTTGPASAAAASAASPAAAEQLGRLRALEEQVQVLGGARGPSVGGQSFAVLEGRVDAQRADVEALARQLAEAEGELRAQLTEVTQQHDEQQQEVTRCWRSEQKALAVRVDDINLRVGALKVKADGVEGRLHSGIERAERVDRVRELEMDRWPNALEEKLLQHVDDRCNMLADELDGRLESLDDTCDETVENALERRLAVLSGELLLKPDRVPERRRLTFSSRISERGPHAGGFAASSGLGRSAGRAQPVSNRLGTPRSCLTPHRGDLASDL